MGEAPKTADPLLGRVLAGKFQIRELIGTGSMGRVYRAQHTALDRVIAVKVLNELDDPTVAARFKAEARAASRLDHPNSVQIFDFGEDQKLLYIAMELLEGENLGDVLKRERRFTPRRAVEVMQQILAALGAAHRGGVIHRDLKPANIMLVKRHNDDGEVTDFVKVCDFGIAKLIHVDGGAEATALALTKDGAVFGTPAFMSPEQARGERVDARSDLFSCGVILYKMLSGTIPFRAQTAPDMLAKLITLQPDPLASHVPDVDPRLAAVVERALEKDRSARFQTAQDMRAALKDASGIAGAAALEERTVLQPLRPAGGAGEPTSPPLPAAQPAQTMPPLHATGHGTRRTIGAPVPVIDTRAKPPPVLSRRTWILLAAVLAAGGAVFLGVRARRDPARVLAQLMVDRSFGIAESHFLEHFEALRDDPQANELIRTALRMRRELEGYGTRTEIKWDPAYRLERSEWRGETTFEEIGSRYDFVLTINEVRDATFTAVLDWPERGIAAFMHGIHDGNLIVLWDERLIRGEGAVRRGYRLRRKMGMMISGDHMTAIDVVPPDKLEAKRTDR